jgi:hypothetical protein
VLPALLWWIDPAGTTTSVLVLASVLFGELLDRCELYAELAIMTPALQMSRGLRERLSEGPLSVPAPPTK